jgi:hypothetical protein
VSNSGLTARNRNDFKTALEFRRSRSASNVAMSGPWTTSPGIALHLGRVAPIIMDAMSDEDQRGIAKQHHTIDIDVTSPRRSRWCRDARRRLPLVVRARLRAIHDVVFLDQCEPGGPSNVVSHQHEDQRPAASLFHGYIGDC